MWRSCVETALSRRYGKPRAALYDEENRFVRYLKQDDAEALVASGTAYIPEDGRCADSGHIRVLRVGTAPSKNVDPLSLNDPTFITRSEVELNAYGAAGMARRKRPHRDFKGRETRGNRVNQVMDKIEAWPSIGDTLAVRVGPRA
jgi:hypothetical protein